MSASGADREQRWNLEAVGRFDPGVPLAEGIALQALANRRRVLWLPVGVAPARVIGVDVTDPAKPVPIASIALPSAAVCCAASVAGDRLALAVGSEAPGADGVGFFLCDVANPAAPRVVGHVDLAAPHGRGAQHVWFADETTLHVCASAPDCVPHDARDDALWQQFDVTDFGRPRVTSRWWLPGTVQGDAAPAPRRVDARFDTGHRVHSARTWPDRADRVWLACGDGGLVVLDIADPAQPRPALRWSHSPPYHGGTHAAVPLGRTGFALVADAPVVDAGADAPKHAWIVDVRADAPDRAQPGGPVRRGLAVGSLPPPPFEAFAPRGGRHGACGLHAAPPGPGHLVSPSLAIAAFGNGGVRVHDVTDPYAPVEVAYHVPAATTAGPTQIHAVLADDRGLVFAVERCAGGLLVLALDL